MAALCRVLEHDLINMPFSTYRTEVERRALDELIGQWTAERTAGGRRLLKGAFRLASCRMQRSGSRPASVGEAVFCSTNIRLCRTITDRSPIRFVGDEIVN